MTIPPPPARIITPEGRTAYFNPYSGAYTTSRSYAERMQRGFARGLSQSEARGHTPTQGLTESQWRRLNRLYISEINRRTLPNAAPGRMIRRDGQRDDPRIFRQDVIDIIILYQQGYRDPVTPTDDWLQWVEIRLQSRLDATIEFQENNDTTLGRGQFYSRSSFWTNTTGIWTGPLASSAPPIAFWYYH